MQENKNSEEIKVFQYCYEHKKICCEQKIHKEESTAVFEGVVEHIKNKKEKDWTKSVIDELMEGKPDLYDENTKTL